ncbi:sulfur oxidation c-type cytochrome SoxX [Breoghania sp. L-A4]|uniref:sulfur oxidation c-type cytochrome SoxX n=1 Tax=Breoghania sp. L-A4 TaxID=2304600 RepID=UPI000E35E0D0|nr:sulfur oxidation c-type cytochrome SoxX [Breoghania sp. L-A4]AXS40480.1 sulfur oxidation c-type cytochrome SoxX [Breoghania sp. L-A4]
MKILRTSLAAAGVLALSLVAAQAGKPAYEIVDGGIAVSLTGKPGDPAAGKVTLADRKLGNCLACHVVSDLSDLPFHGEVAPPLDGVADRYDEAQLRLLLVDSKKVFEGTIMPAFYKSEGFNRPLDKFEGKSILTADQVEDVLAYLLTLKEQ